MNKFELKKKLNKAYPDLNGSTINDIMTFSEFINTDVQTMIDNSVASVKNLYSVQTIDEYAEDIKIYTQKFLDKLDKLGVHWLISHLPTGVNFSSDEMKNITSEPFILRTEWVAYWTKQLMSHRHDTFIIINIQRTELADSKIKYGYGYLVRGAFVKKSIFANLLQE